MCVEVLATRAQNIHAREEMRRRGLDFVTPKFFRALRKTRLLKGANVGDPNKSWDVLKTVEFLERNHSRTSAILDIGAYASEVLCSLHKLGFSDLSGIDLDPRVTYMPYADHVKYLIGDFMSTPFPPCTFQAITAISVLEHGFKGSKVFSEVSRILAPGGHFLGTIDYWPEKIDTQGIRAYGLDWTIFSKEEILDLIEDANHFGLMPVGPIDFRVSGRPATWFNKQFTVAWLALQKI
jgi:SAM-dependent methyltransferase